MICNPRFQKTYNYARKDTSKAPWKLPIECGNVMCCIVVIVVWCIVMCRIDTALHFIRNSEDCFPTSFDSSYDIIWLYFHSGQRVFPVLISRLGQRAWMLLRSRAWTIPVWRHGRPGMMRPWKMAIGLADPRSQPRCVVTVKFKGNVALKCI